MGGRFKASNAGLRSSLGNQNGLPADSDNRGEAHSLWGWLYAFERTPGHAGAALLRWEEPGAGEANRTPDPNLGKVMLYP